MHDPSASSPRGRDRAALAALLLLLCAWGLDFIWRTSFAVRGQRTFCLFDDAMISMTYARNLLDGQGLEWARQGEPVEGFTHPLWLAAMLPANLPAIPLPLRSLFVQLLSLALLFAVVVALKRLAQDHFVWDDWRLWLPAAVLTAFYYPLAYWSLLGMETALQALLMILAVDRALAISERGEDRHRVLWGVCATAYLLRMDLLLLVLVVQSWVVSHGGLRDPGHRRHWIQGLAVFVAVGLGYEICRLLYFHDLLPNTYYLKLTGVPLDVRLTRGLATFTAFAASIWPLLVGVAIGVGIAARRDRRLLLPAALIAAFFAYDVWIGGDVWELSEYDIDVDANRFVAPLMPLVFLLLVALANRALSAWSRRSATGLRPWHGRAAAIALTLVALVVANDLAFAPTAAGHWREWALTDPPPNVERHREVATHLFRLRRMVSPEAVVATAWAGIPAFFSDYRMIDILGYNDRRVARMPSVVPLDRRDWQRYVPGHVKWDERRLLEVQRPDAFFQIWGVKELGPVHEVLHAAGYRQLDEFWVRTDSPYVHALRPGAEQPPP